MNSRTFNKFELNLDWMNRIEDFLREYLISSNIILNATILAFITYDILNHELKHLNP